MKKLLLAAMVPMAGCAHAGVRPPRADEVRVREIEQGVLDERNAEMYQQLRWADSTAYVVASSNTVNCPDDASVSRVGITSVDENEFLSNPNSPLRYIPAKIGRTVQSVIPGSPADRGSVEPGDIITNYDAWLEAVENPTRISRLGVVTTVEPLPLRVFRPEEEPFRVRGAPPGEIRDVSLRPQETCTLPTIAFSDEVAAFTDGEIIVVTMGMIEAVENPDEMAFVVAHELAHIVAGHIDKRNRNAFLGGLLGAFVDVLACGGRVVCPTRSTRAGMAAGATAFSVEFEEEADYFAALFLIRAGFDSEVAAGLWLRMASASGLGYSQTHPAYAGRYANIIVQAEEIRRCAERLGGVLFLTTSSCNDSPGGELDGRSVSGAWSRRGGANG